MVEFSSHQVKVHVLRALIKLNFHKMHALLDAKLVADAINSRVCTSDWQIRHIVTECRAIVRNNPVASIHYTQQRANSIAHNLAYIALQYSLYGY